MTNKADRAKVIWPWTKAVEEQQRRDALPKAVLHAEHVEVSWEQQNEATTKDGAFLQGRASFRAEMRELRECGAPDTKTAVFVSHEATDRDSATFTARVSPALATWITDQVNNAF